MPSLIDVENSVLEKLTHTKDATYTSKYKALLTRALSLDDANIMMELKPMMEGMLDSYSTEDLARLYRGTRYGQTFLKQGRELPPRLLMMRSIVIELQQRIVKTIYVEAHRQLSPQPQAA